MTQPPTAQQLSAIIARLAAIAARDESLANSVELACAVRINDVPMAVVPPARLHQDAKFLRAAADTLLGLLSDQPMETLQVHNAKTGESVNLPLVGPGGSTPEG